MNFWKALFLLLKYRITMWNNIPKRRGRRGKASLSFFLIIVILGAAFGVPGYFLFESLLSKYVQVSFGVLTLADLFVEMSLIGVLALVILIDTPAVILSVFMSEDVEYLLTLPIPQASIFYFKILETLIEGTFPAFFFVPLLIAYANVTHMNWYTTALAFVLYAFYVLFCAGISGFISLSLSKVVSKSGTKRFMFFSSTATLALAFLMMNITSMPALNTSNAAQALSAYISKLNLSLWPSTWFLRGIRGDYLYILALIGASLGLFGTSFIFARKSLLAGVSNVKSSSNKTKKEKNERPYKAKKVFSALLSKEFKLLKREPSVLFMVIYPAIFPIIFMFPSSSNRYVFLTGELMGVFMASTYLIISMASLVSIDVKAEWVLKSLPVPKKTILWSKALMLTAVYESVLLLTFIVISTFLGGLWYALLLLTLALPMFLMATFFGSYAVTKWPNPNGGTKKPLNVSGSLISTAVSVLIAGVVAAESLYIYFHGEMMFFRFNFWLNTLLFLIVPIFIEITFIIFTLKKVKNIDWGDPFESRN